MLFCVRVGGNQRVNEAGSPRDAEKRRREAGFPRGQKPGETGNLFLNREIKTRGYGKRLRFLKIAYENTGE